MRGMQGVTTTVILTGCVVLCWMGGSVEAWTNEEFEMFDLVEEIAPVTFYEFLGIPQDAKLREIKSAYRQLSVKLHPDKNPDDSNAEVKFRQLVGVYEALKDEELRKSYHNVLEFGLPNWRQPVFYFRRARKLAIWHVCLILLGIVTTGQYLAAWGAWFERKLSLNEYMETAMRKTRRSKKTQKEIEETQKELEEKFLQKPSVYNTAPFQLFWLGKYMVVQFPFDVMQVIQDAQEAKRIEKERLLEEQRLQEEEEKAASEPKKPRKRKTFQIPEKEQNEDEEFAKGDSAETPQEKADTKTQEVFVSGGLWTDDDIAQLIKLCTKYPGGYPDRWNQISMIMRRPVNEVTHMAKKVLEDLNKKQEEEEEPVVPVKVKVKTKGSNIDDNDMMQRVQNWTKDDQKRLEAALQMYPKSTVGDRWAKIASHVGKSKEECMQRYKYVAELVKKKKQEEQEQNEQVESKPTENVPSCEESQVSSKQQEQSSSSRDQDDSKEVASRKDSSSSNSSASGSDNDWCVVNSSNDN